MGIFSRSNVEISDSNLRNLVITWTGKEEQSIDVFCKLLQSIGIVTPVILSNFNDEEASFDCITDDGKTLSLALWNAGLDGGSQLIVKEGKLCSCYNYNNRSKNVHLELESTAIERNNNRLDNFYCKSFCSRILTLSGDYCVTVDVAEPEPRDKNNVLVMNPKLSIDNYLLGLTFPCTAQDIYEKVMKLYEFDDSIIPSISSIKVSVEKILSKDNSGNASKKRTMSAIFMKHGKVYQYVVNEDDVAYSIAKNGDWFYSTPYAHYSFSADTNRISVAIEADKTTICALNNADVIKTACEKVNSIRGKIN